MFGYDRRTELADVTDGTSNTILLWETARDNGPWARGGSATVRGLDPADVPYAGSGRPFGGLHFAERALFLSGSSTGSSLGMADGTVRWVSNGVPADLLNGLATVAGNESPPSDW